MEKKENSMDVEISSVKDSLVTSMEKKESEEKEKKTDTQMVDLAEKKEEKS